jgi:CheY-like chemotaxis protein
MSAPLRVLLVEDSERDAALLLLYLRRGGFQPSVRRIETAAQMSAELTTEPWDLVISDVNLPGFGAMAALRLLQETGVQIPFIVLSGEADEKVISEIESAGATSYLLKGDMPRLIDAIKDALRGRP